MIQWMDAMGVENMCDENVNMCRESEVERNANESVMNPNDSTEDGNLKGEVILCEMNV